MSVALSSADIARALVRLSHEILEANALSTQITLLGIPTRGAHLAQRISRTMAEIAGHEIPVGMLDITMHRDDLRMRPPRAIMATVIPHEGVNDRDVIFIDDVLFSGRTIRAALDAIGEVGRPRSVQLAVLVDRGHRELPIRADFVGKNLPTSIDQAVKVHLVEIEDVDEVLIENN